MIDVALKDQVRRFIVEAFMFADDSPELEDDASLLDLGVIDSTGILELVMFLEETFQLTVHNGELVPENLDSVERIVDFVSRKREGILANPE